MKMRLAAGAALAAAFSMMSLFAQSAGPQGRELRVISSNGIRAVLEQVVPQAEKTIGRRIAIEFGTSASLKRRIEEGAAFDLAILSSDTLDSLIQADKVAATSRTDLARSGIGVGIRSGTAKPNIGTPDALKQTLLRAKSITYAQSGASRTHIDAMMERFGIVADMRPKTRLEADSALGRAAVAEGRVELLLTLVSEILEFPGIELAGPLPAEVQAYVIMSAGAGTRANDADGARALIGFLSAPAMAPVIESKGMQRQ